MFISSSYSFERTLLLPYFRDVVLLRLLEKLLSRDGLAKDVAARTRSLSKAVTDELDSLIPASSSISLILIVSSLSKTDWKS